MHTSGEMETNEMESGGNVYWSGAALRVYTSPWIFSVPWETCGKMVFLFLGITSTSACFCRKTGPSNEDFMWKRWLCGVLCKGRGCVDFEFRGWSLVSGSANSLCDLGKFSH